MSARSVSSNSGATDGAVLATAGRDSGGGGSGGVRRAAVLAPCAHLFHADCMTALEDYSVSKQECPICRAGYERFDV